MVEETIPDIHQTALAYGSQGLELREVLWPLVLLHAAQADADGAGGDDDHAVAIFTQLVCGLDYEREVGEKRLVGLLVHYGTCSWGKVLVLPYAMCSKWSRANTCEKRSKCSHQVLLRCRGTCDPSCLQLSMSPVSSL